MYLCNLTQIVFGIRHGEKGGRKKRNKERREIERQTKKTDTQTKNGGEVKTKKSDSRDLPLRVIVMCK